MNWGLIISNEGVASVDHGEERVESKGWPGSALETE